MRLLPHLKLVLKDYYGGLLVYSLFAFVHRLTELLPHQPWF